MITIMCVGCGKEIQKVRNNDPLLKIDKHYHYDCYLKAIKEGKEEIKNIHDKEIKF